MCCRCNSPKASRQSRWGSTPTSVIAIGGFAEPLNAGELPKTCTVRVGEVEFEATVRIDTPKEADYFRHGGILQYVLRQLLAA